MPHFTITNTVELQDLLDRLQEAPVIAYDTEFISENRYFPQLCLVQIAAGNLLALVDPLSVGNLDPLWELFCDGRREIVVHACRSEMEFCHRAIGRMPSRLFDVQLAAGFLGCDYPTGYGTLLDRFLKVELPKAESRTVWSKRPLTSQQVEYALGDVRYLERLAQTQKKLLTEQGRLDWCNEENDRVKRNLQNDFEQPRWRNLPKTTGLKPRELAILRELWLWREHLARKRNSPASRVLRDDLVVELARRGTSDAKRISAVRGLQRSDLSRILPELSAAVERGLSLSKEELPTVSERLSYPQYSVMAQFLYAALCSKCKQERIAAQLVGGPGDVRELVAAEIGTLPEGIKPKLLGDWRTQLIGSFLSDLLNGRKSIRLDRSKPEDPLVFTDI